MSGGARAAALSLPLLLFALPIAASLPVALWQGLDASAWAALATDPQLPRALALSITTALVSTLLALALALWWVTHLHGSRAWTRLVRALGPLLALPHAAFAIGLALLVMPAGVIARVLAVPFAWSLPPAWPTVNDPHGVGLMLVLVCKETPFLLWNLVALLARPELALQLRGWLAAGRTLGYADAAIWWRALWPLLLPRLAWPLLAVLAYGLTVVDLALIIGPASPPTLAVLAWQALQDAQPERNAEGATSVLLLALALAGCIAALALAAIGAQRAFVARATSGRRPRIAPSPQPARAASAALWLLLALYATVLLLLALSSFTGVWTFPSLLPQSWTDGAWQQVRSSLHTLMLSAGLGAFAALAALALVLIWFEATTARWDERVMPLVLAPLVLPSLLLMVGLYTLALPLRLDGSLAGLAWVHTLVALPYVFVALAPAWRSFDRRFEHTALALGRSRAAFWWRVKAPLLAAPIAAALAVGFAVSVAQYLPTQFIGAGRHATVTTEAVTLASGGQRHGAAAFALLQALLPAIGFGLAAAVGRRQRLRIEPDGA
uniref:ABC transporter permease n=1 Tax=uncultured bacterium 51 TaxID=1748279 RepID=A0A0U3TY94_9BACT|nr:ABC transporter permease [uncultured bacterium 51]